jgi:UDP-N-acetylglucosamine 2-epimerase (non-hydrolysing)
MIAVVAGARPNVVKVAPILREMKRREVAFSFVWTGQHRAALDLRSELGCPPPDVDLSEVIGSDTPSRSLLDQIAMLLTLDWARARPDVVVVVGDVTSTLAAALAATAHGIPVVHVEAGLRSGDWTMPEERNRVIVDRLSDLALCTERGALANLTLGTHAHVVGNVMIDSLRWAENELKQMYAPTTDRRAYALVTLHRPSNVDTYEAWQRSGKAIDAIRDRGLNVVFVRHPRQPIGIGVPMREIVKKGNRGGLLTIDPRPYVEMVRLMKDATLVATDSGGVQEETTALGVPCLTLRENTERPVTVEVGTNTVVGLDPERISAEVDEILAGNGKRGKIPWGWDGRAAERVVHAIQGRYL